jgi:hypothetical protein
MSKKQRKKAHQVASRLRGIGQFDTARRLVEAFNLDKEFFVGQPELAPDEAMADLDDDEVTSALPGLERYIPVEASLPDDLDEEGELVFDTGVFEVSGE